MKSLSQLKESFDVNPGNGLNCIGVMNHLTPVANIITNVRNLFATRLGVVVEPGEDGVSLKLHSSQFVNQDAVNKVLDNFIYTNLSLRMYIQQQGLDFIKMINLGQYWVVYFLPSDLYSQGQAGQPNPVTTPTATVKEMLNLNIVEAEMFGTVNEDVNGEEELEDKTIEEIIELIDDDDKIKAASKLAEVIAKKMELPAEYYWKAVKDQDGKESVALRYKYQKRRPFGKKIDVVKSILNIYNSGHDAVWVDGFDDKDKMDDDMKTLIENILKLIGAEETKDPCIFDIPEPKADDEENKDENEENSDENSDDNSSEENKDDNSSEENSSESDNEEDKK